MGAMLDLVGYDTASKLSETMPLGTDKSRLAVPVDAVRFVQLLEGLKPCWVVTLSESELEEEWVSEQMPYDLALSEYHRILDACAAQPCCRKP